MNYNVIPMHYPHAWETALRMLQNNWSPFEQEMGHDRVDLSSLAEPEQRLHRIALANLTTADVQIMKNVGLGVLNGLNNLELLHEAPEIEIVLAIQAQQEALHTISYQHILESVLSLSQQEQAEVYQLWRDVPAMRAKFDLAAMTTAFMSDPDVALSDYLYGLAFYYAVYEGGWFMGGFDPLFAIAHWRHAMFGTVEQIRYIRRDETEHVAFGLWLIGQIKREHPGVFDVAEFYETVRNAGRLEADFANYLLPSPVLGYSAEAHVAHFRHLMNLRCRQLGIAVIYPEVSQSPFPWLAEQAELKKEKNFFETRVHDYRVGSNLEWEDKR